MRLSTNMIYNLSTNSILQQQSQLAHVRQQLASGDKILTPADAPRDAAHALVLSQALAVNDQFASGREIARRHLSSQVVELKSVTNALNAAKPLLVQAGNGTLSNPDLDAVATELQGVYQQLLNSAMARDGNGNYIFSGYEINVQPFKGGTGSLTYDGDDGKLDLQVSGSRRMTVNHTAQQIFASVTKGSSYVTTADSGNSSGGSVAISGTPTVTVAGDWQLQGGHAYDITFDKVEELTTGDYNITYTVTNKTTGSTSTTGPVTYTPVAGSDFQIQMGASNGLTVNFDGVPDVGDAYHVTATAPYEVQAAPGNSVDMAVPEIAVTDPAGTHIQDGDNFKVSFNEVAKLPDPANPDEYRYYIDYTVKNVDEGTTASDTFYYYPTSDGPLKISGGAGMDMSLTFADVPKSGDVFNINKKSDAVMQASYAVDPDEANNSNGAAEFSNLHITDASDPEIQAANDYKISFSTVDNTQDSDPSTYTMTYTVENTTTGVTSPAQTVVYNASTNEPFSIGMGASNGLSISFTGIPDAGDVFHVTKGANTNTDASGDPLYGDKNILNTIANVIKQLKAGADTPQKQAALSNSVDSALRKLDNSLTNVVTIRAEVGSKINELDSLNTMGSNRFLNYKTTLSSLTDLNFAKAASRYVLNQVALKMAQKTFTDIQKLSLFKLV